MDIGKALGAGGAQRERRLRWEQEAKNEILSEKCRSPEMCILIIVVSRVTFPG